MGKEQKNRQGEGPPLRSLRQGEQPPLSYYSQEQDYIYGLLYRRRADTLIRRTDPLRIEISKESTI